MTWLSREPRPWERVVVSLVLVGLAAAFRAEFLGPLGVRTPYVTFFPAVTIAALYGGLLSGMLATVVSALLAGFWVQKGVIDPNGWVAMVVFLLTCGLLSAICESTRRARKRLEAANDQLGRAAALLQLTHDSILVRDLDDRVTFWSRGARERFGWTEEEALGSVAHDLLRTVFPSPLEEIRATLAETGRWEGELVQTRKDGSRLVVASRWARQEDDAGIASGVLEINNDITERKKAEEALRESQAILQAAMDQSPAGIAIANAPDGKLRYVNDAGLLIRGGTRDTIVRGVGIDRYVASWQLLDLDGRPLAPDEVPLARAVLFGETCAREFIIRRDDDDRVVLGNAAPIRDGAGKVTAAIVIFTDITDGKRTEAALRESKDQYQKLSEELEQRVLQRTAELSKSRWLLDETSRLSLVGGWEYDLRTNKLTWTDVIYEIYEVEPGLPLTVESVFRYFAPESRLRITEVFRRAVTTGEAYDEELELVTARERRKWVRAIGYADFEDGRVVTVHGLLQDIQAHKERIAALEDANKELEAFSYSISHDLRAPVRAIDGFARLLEKHTAGSLDEEGQRLLATVRRNSLRMGHLIDDLLTYARAARNDIRSGTIDMVRLVSEVLPEVVPEERSGQVEIRVGELPPARGDRALVRQVILNLLDNAVKFTGTRTKAVIEVGSRRADGVVEYFVRDNGVGFDQKYVGKLFGVFQRLHSEKHFAGTGIGLSLVRRIVERHGGKVRAEGAVGEGATISFTLGPALPGQEAAEAPA